MRFFAAAGALAVISKHPWFISVPLGYIICPLSGRSTSAPVYERLMSYVEPLGLSVMVYVNAILVTRLKVIKESSKHLDHEAQCGFRNGRGCTDGTFTIKLLVTKRREHNQETWILFLDLVKAFDKVPRELLRRVLTKFGVPDKMVSILKAVENGQRQRSQQRGPTAGPEQS